MPLDPPPPLVPLAPPAAGRVPLQKVVIAVHGIGDQVRNSTALATTIRFCDTFGYPGTVPLGAFDGVVAPGHPAVSLAAASYRTIPGFTDAIGFAEVHWAHVPRKIVEDKYTLQETKAWARSVVNRLRVLAWQHAQRRRARHSPDRAPAVDYQQIRLVLESMIEAISLLESLFFLAGKAGIFRFELKQMLENFLGDVQLVADFPKTRKSIIAQFHDALAAVHREHPGAQIHLVAHSEGTVVSFLGLLEALGDPEAYPWIRDVRGFMTIGSPLDKHLILWPELFAPFTGPKHAPGAPHRIRWINYTDIGDPVGYELDSVRHWLRSNGYTRAIQFRKRDDLTFSRYSLPGKAHVDYWTDAAVFGHFIRHVVDRPPAAAPGPDDAGAALPAPPRNRFWPRITGLVLPYAIPALILWIAAYVFCRGLGAFLLPAPAATASPVSLRETLALFSLLAGTTVFLRIWQLARAPLVRAAGLVMFVAGAAGFHELASDLTAPSARPVVEWLSASPLAPDLLTGQPVRRVLAGVAILVGLVLFIRALRQFEMWGMQMTDRAARWAGRRRRHREPAAAAGAASRPRAAPGVEPPPRWPPATHLLRQMLLWSALTLGLILALDWMEHRELRGPLWPLLLTFAGFLYLWRLAAIFFDLGYIWHRYIRWSRSSAYLREAVYSREECDRRAAEDLAADAEPDDVPEPAGQR